MSSVKVWQWRRSTKLRSRRVVTLIRSESGGRVALPIAPLGAELRGWADRVATTDRSGRMPLTTNTGAGLPTLEVTLTLAHFHHQTTIVRELAALKKLAESGERIIISGMSQFERGPWLLDDLQVTVLDRQEGTNEVTRAEVGLSFVMANEPVVRVRLRKPPKPKPKPKPKAPAKSKKKKTQYTTMKRGQTLSHIALRYYGNANLWRPIAKASKIKDPRRIRVGQKITIPPR